MMRQTVYEKDEVLHAQSMQVQIGYTIVANGIKTILTERGKWIPGMNLQ